MRRFDKGERSSNDQQSRSWRFSNSSKCINLMTRILHQVWIQGEDALPEKFRKNREMWRSMLPGDWEMILWDNEKAKKQWPEYARVESKCYHHATRADLILARCIRDIGGLATGTDAQPLNPGPMLRFLEIAPTMVVIDPRAKELSNGLVWSANPGHPFFKCVCNHQLRKDGSLLCSKSVASATGPGCYNEAFLAHRWDLCCVTVNHAYDRHWTEKKRVNPDAWIDPGYAASWL